MSSHGDRNPRALVLVADGSEEMEAVISVDVLRRGKVDVVVASVGKAAKNDVVFCSRHVQLVADATLDEVAEQEFDVIVLPGGGNGAKAFAASETVGKILKRQESAGKFVAAICASPTVLKAHGIGTGKQVTSYPSMKKELEGEYAYKEDAVVVDGKLVTSQGPGTSFAFALKLVELLSGKEVAEKLPGQLILN